MRAMIERWTRPRGSSTTKDARTPPSTHSSPPSFSSSCSSIDESSATWPLKSQSNASNSVGAPDQRPSLSRLPSLSSAPPPLARKQSRSDSVGYEKASYAVLKTLVEAPKQFMQCDLVQQIKGTNQGSLYIDKHTNMRLDHHVACATMRELEVHLALQRHGPIHTNVLPLQRSYMDGERLHLILEYQKMEPLERIVLTSSRSGGLEFDEAIEYFRQVCEGLAFVHARGIAHLKLSLNCLHRTTEDGMIKLGDFNRARFVHNAAPLEHTAMDTAWCAPELLAGENAPVEDLQKADVWSLGVLLVALLCGRLPFLETSLQNANYRVLRHQGVREMLERSGLARQMRCTLTDDMVDLVENLFQSDPHMRPSVRQVLDHPFMVEAGSP